MLNTTKQSKIVKTRRRLLNNTTFMQSLLNFKNQFQRVIRVGGSWQEDRESIKEEEMETESLGYWGEKGRNIKTATGCRQW